MLWLFLAAVLDPSAAIGIARQHLAEGDCGGAVRVLARVLPEALEIENVEERSAAAGAVHFYSALAQAECGRLSEASGHLREFFTFRPDLTTIDETRYSRPFVRLFKETQRSVQSIELFDRVYPGFDRYADVAVDEVPLQLWGTNAGFQILAAPEEKEEWGRLRTDAERQDFIERFWSSRRRDVVNRRVAFADQVFSAGRDVRGALSDRGRVFVILGPPARVYRSGLKRYDTTIVQERARTPLTGTLERWVYLNWQLPKGVAPKEVEFRFITQPGYGDGVMQKDFWPMKALAEVGLSLPQYRLLAFLSGGPERATALAGWLDVSPPSLTALVDGRYALGLRLDPALIMPAAPRPERPFGVFWVFFFSPIV